MGPFYQWTLKAYLKGFARALTSFVFMIFFLMSHALDINTLLGNDGDAIIYLAERHRNIRTVVITEKQLVPVYVFVCCRVSQRDLPLFLHV